MRLLSFLAGLMALFSAGSVAAQTPAPPPTPPVSPENVWNLDLSTGGRVSIQLRPDVAPNHVERIRTLTRQGFYDGLIFHRVVEGFMAQGGDPTGSGTGGSTLPDLEAEIKGLPHVRGAVGMARAEAMNSANSQFYIMFVPRLSMDRDYTVFGRVISGMPYVDAIERGAPPLAPTRIVKASIGSDNVAPLPEAVLRAAAAPVPPAPESLTESTPASLPGEGIETVPVTPGSPTVAAPDPIEAPVSSADEGAASPRNDAMPGPAPAPPVGEAATPE